jgi:hypothetical protein
LIGKPKVILTGTNLDDLPSKNRALLDEFVDIIVYEFPNDLPPIRIISHQIDLILRVQYIMTPKKNQEIINKIQELLDNGLIRESLSPCFVPTIMNPKKNGGWRMCNYYKEINKIIIRYIFPLLCMDDLMDCLSGANLFSNIYLKKWVSSN